MTVTHKISLDLVTKDNSVVIDVSQGDFQTRIVEAHLFVGGVPFIVPDGFSASLAFKKPDKTGGWYDELPDGSAAATINGNVILIYLAEEVCQAAGKVQASIVLKNNIVAQLTVFPFFINVVGNATSGESISNSYYKITSLGELNQELQNIDQTFDRLQEDFDLLNNALGQKMDKGVADRPLNMSGHDIKDTSGLELQYGDGETTTGYVRMSAFNDYYHDELGYTCGVLELSGGVDADSQAILRNVAPGVNPFDAATVGQLNDAVPPVTDEKYFTIDFDGVVSLKNDYQAGGSKNAELPEIIVIPDVIGGTAVAALSDYMFQKNLRVKSVTIPNSLRRMPKGFANEAYNLAEVKGTENIEVIGNGALRKCGIKKALFPKLKSFEGTQQFYSDANLSIVDIGNTVNSIPKSCFYGCESLSLILGGLNITTIGDMGFFATRRLKNLPFIENVTSIGKDAFALSRVNFDWWTFKNTSECTFGTNATPAQFNPTGWWSGCTYEECENPLGSTFSQQNPEWAFVQIPNSSDTYGSGCVEISAAHIYSALTGVKFNTPRYFVESVVGGIDNGSLLTPTGQEDGEPAYTGEDMVNWFTALGLDSEKLSGGYNSSNLQKVYNALKEGALILMYIHPGHAAVLYGVASNGEVLTLDSSSYQHNIGVYEARTFQQPIWTLTFAGCDVITVRKVA